MSKNQNKLKGALVLITLAVWGVVAWQILQSRGGVSDRAHPSSEPVKAGMDLSILQQKPIAYDSTRRDPFDSYLYAAPPVVKTKKASRKPDVLKKIVKPPTATLAGFLGGAQPVAILKNGEATELLKVGEEAWGFKVLKVSKSLVLVEKEGRTFEIRP